MSDQIRHLRGLQAFDVAARCGSLSQAAEELAVTHGAVSRQIKQLETHLGLSLFRRRPNGVELTEPGRRLHEATQRGFRALREGVLNARRFDDNTSITISLSASLATKWLVARLAAFRQAHPGLSVYLDTNDEIIELQSSPVDVALRYGTPGWDGLHYERLTSEQLIVVAAPSIAKRFALPHKPEEIAQLPLLSDEFDPAWQRWAVGNGLDPSLVSEPVVRFADSAVLIAAAIDGQGVALARRLLVEDDLNAGRLVRLDNSTTATAPDRSLYFVCRKGDEERLPVRTFRNWLLSLTLP
ncbi:MAG: LysR family transcriptional regulator [Rhizobiaceae bacterium]|nr:LysR family transcriptional regulator [Rhizobiaceae bacterium]